MDMKRVHEIVKNREIRDIYYDERPIWIQEVKDDIVHVGFMDNNEEKDVYIEDLYEDNLYKD